MTFHSTPKSFAAAMSLPLLLLCAMGNASAAEFDATSAKAFFGAHGCNACHAQAEFRIGPPFEAVGLRWAGDPEGRVELIAAKIRHGGAGAWGLVPMVSNPKITPEEAEAISRWILAQRPSAGTATTEPAGK